jgi:hypothetical protein
LTIFGPVSYIASTTTRESASYERQSIAKRLQYRRRLHYLADNASSHHDIHLRLYFHLDPHRQATTGILDIQ